MRRLFLPGVEIAGEGRPWWLRGVLANGVDEYAEDMRRDHGIVLPGLSDPG
jgi:hypothetical protein